MQGGSELTNVFIKSASLIRNLWILSLILMTDE